MGSGIHTDGIARTRFYTVTPSPAGRVGG
jgi:hypothetical protein